MIRQLLDRRLQTAITFSFLALVFFLPLLVSTRSSEVFELPKMLFVYAMTAVIVGLWLMRMAVRRQILIRRTALDIPILLFLISQMASTIYSIDPHVSWWGWYGRFHGGLVSTISYTLFYYAFVTNFVDSNKESPGRTPRRLLNTIIASATIVSVYAIFQHFGVDKNFWVQDVVNRVFSTQGQPNWLAAYLVMAIPLTFAIGVNSSLRGAPTEGRGRRGNLGEILPPAIAWRRSNWRAGRSAQDDGRLIMISYFLFMTYVLALLWTKSRSGMIGLAVADLVFWSLIFWRFYLQKNKSYIDQQRSFKKEPTFSGTKELYRSATIVSNLYNSNKNVSVFTVFVFIHSILAILILVTNNPARETLFNVLSRWNGSKTDEIATVAALPRNDEAAMESGITLRKSEQGGTESGDIRRIVWNGAIQLVKQRPWFGFGPETFGETYWRVRPKEHNLTSEWNFLYNKAHNEWLNLAANTGLFGLGSHILIILWFSAWSIKRTLLGVRQGESLINTAILAGLLGVEAVNFFGFSTVTVGAFQYLFMGLAVTLNSTRDRRLTSGDDPSRSILQGSSLTVAAVVVFYILSRVFILFLADLAYNRGRAYQDAGYIEEAVEPLIQAVNLAPAEPVFRAELAEAEGATAAILSSQERTLLDESQGESLIETTKQLKNDSLANFELVRRQSPYNLGFLRTEARILFLLGEEEPALQLMKAAMEMAPTNPQLPYSLGQMLSKMGKEAEAAVYYNKAVELKPDYQEAIKILNTEY